MLTYLSLKEDEEDFNAPSKCCNCKYCKKDENLDVYYSYCLKHDKFIINSQEWADNCVYYKARGVDLEYKSLLVVMILAIVLLGALQL